MTANSTNEIKKVLSYYHDEVIPALAAAVTIDDRFPIEVLNEVRNAFTHLSRAQCMEGADDAKCKECEGALRHLKRTVLDCMKVCILALAKKSETIMDALAGEAALPNGTTAQARDLRKRRRELSSYEGQNSTDDAIEKLSSSSRTTTISMPISQLNSTVNLRKRGDGTSVGPNGETTGLALSWAYWPALSHQLSTALWPG